jgi:autotransporter-associated beta strand protein
MKASRILFAWLISFSAATVFSTSSYGQTNRTWDGSSSTAWDTPANWSGNDVPNTVGEVALFSNATGNDPASFGTAITIGGFSLTGGEARSLIFTNTIALDQYGVDNSSGLNLSITGAGTTTLTAAQTWSVNGTGNTTFGKTIANGGLLLTLNGSNTGTGTITSGISGLGGITKDGTGTWKLTGSNNYGGNTTISAGALQANDGTGLPTGSFLSLNGGVLQSDGVASFTRSLGTSGSSNFQWTANGGGFAANGGKLTVTIANNAATELVWGTTVGSQIVGTLDFGSATANAETEFQNRIDLGNGTRTVDVAAGTGGDFATLSGVIRNTSGTGNLTKNGTGKLVLSGNNSYNGTTTVSAGTLRATTSANALGLGTLTLSGGILELANDTGLAFNRNTTVTASSTVTSDVLTPTGPAVTHTLGTLGIGTQTLTIAKGSNVGSGTAGITYGAVTLSGNASFSVDTGAQLTIGAITSGGADRTIAFGGPGNTIVSGIIDDATGGANTTTVTKSGTGTLTLATANTYTDVTTISGGKVKIQNNTSLGTTAAGTSVASGAAIQIDGSNLNVAEAITSLNGDGGGTGALQNLGNNNTWSGAITLAGSAVINSDSGLLTIGAGGINESGGSLKDLTFGGAGNVTVTGNITASAGDMRLFKDGAGTLTLSGSGNTFDGLTTVSNGTLAYGVSDALVGGVTVNGGILDIKTFSDTVGTVTLTSGSINGTTGVLTGTSYVLNGALNTSVSARLAGAVNLTKSNAGTATLSGANTYSGTTTVSGGKLVVDGSLGATAVSVSGGASLGGTGSIGTLTGGTVVLNSGTSDGTRGAIDLTDGSIGTLTFANKTAANTTVLTIGGTGTNRSILGFDVGATADQIALGTNARLSIGAGGGLVRLTGLGGLTGATQTLISSSTASTGAGSLTNLTLDATTGNFSGYNVALAVSGNNLNLTQTANAAAAAAFWKGTNDGVWNSFTGGNNNISNFATNVGGTNATGKVGATTDVNFNATSSANFSNTTLGEDFTIKTLTFGSAATSSVGIGGIHTLTITPGSSTTGVTVATGSGNHTISSKVALGANQTWTVTTSGQTLTASNQISGGSNGLTKAGAGTLTFSDVNTYTGDTIIKGGTLKLDGSGSLASNNIIVGDTGSSGAILDVTTKTGGFLVSSGKTVSGIGTINGNTTIQSGAFLSPGNSPGVLSNLGNIALETGSNFNIELNGATPATEYDQLSVAGGVSLAGLLNVTVGYTPALNTLFFILLNDSTDAINGTFSNASVNGNTYVFGGQDFQISYFGDYGTNSFTGGNDVVLMAVPEPGAALLGGLGTLLLLRRRRAA